MNLKSIYQQSMLNKLMLINIAIYLLLSLIGMIMKIFGYDYIYELLSLSYLGLPADPSRLLARIWTPLTYMFVHFDFWHIFGNMLWLFCMGRMFQQVFNNKQTLGVYILGGLSGALLYTLVYNIIPGAAQMRALQICVGASAAVTAIVIAVCVHMPNTKVMIFGPIPLSLKWLGILYVVYDLLQLGGSNAGGHITHLGGAIFGLLFGLYIRKGKDLTNGFNNMIDKIVSWMPSRKSGSRNSKMHVSYKNAGSSTHSSSAKDMTDEEYNQQKAADQKRIDEILDKISKSGYNNLTKEEKDFLFRASKK